MSTIKSSTTTTTAYSVTADTTGALVIQTGATPTTAMTIDTSQNIGIGVTSPSTRLDVRQSTASDLQLQLYNNNAGVFASTIKLNSDNATGSYYNAIQSYNATTGQWQIGGAGSSSTIVFGTGSSFTERARVNAYGIGLGGAVPSSGTGISFPATQSASSDANTLDDYEEGTFTPTLTNFTIVSQTSNNGYYTKIGRQVFLNIIILATSVATTAGSSTVTNLPFAPGLGNFSLVCIANANSISAQNSGGVVNSGGSGTLYPPATTGNAYVVISAMYWV
jgi:hypothetical protein